MKKLTERRGPLSGVLPDDVCRLVDVPPGMGIGRVIFAGPSMVKVGAEYEAVGPLEATFMLQEDSWNGVNHVKAAWDGKMPSAVAMLRERATSYAAKYAARVTPQDDWLSVTVDYHS